MNMLSIKIVVRLSAEVLLCISNFINGEKKDAVEINGDSIKLLVCGYLLRENFFLQLNYDFLFGKTPVRR